MSRRATRPVPRPAARRARGVVLMGLLVLLALAGLALVQVAESVATARQREREADLLWVGAQYQAAL